MQVFLEWGPALKTEGRQQCIPPWIRSASPTMHDDHDSAQYLYCSNSLSFGVMVASQILVQPCNSFCYLGKQLSFLPTSAQVCSTDEVTIFVSLDAAVLPLIIKSTHCVPKDSSNSLNSSPNIQISHITESFQKPDNWGFHHWTALHHLLQETQLHHQKPWLHQCWSDVLAT